LKIDKTEFRPIEYKNGELFHTLQLELRLISSTNCSEILSTVENPLISIL